MILGTSKIWSKSGPGDLLIITKMLQKIQEKLWNHPGKIRRPLEEGPPGCEAFARSSIFDLGLRWNHITALIFGIFTFLDPLNGQSLISHVSCLMSQVSWTVYCPPKKLQSPSNHRRLRIWDDPRITMKIHQSSSRSPRQQKPWKLVPRLPKIMKNRPRNHKKSNFCESWFLQYIPCQIHVFPIPDTEI